MSSGGDKKRAPRPSYDGNRLPENVKVDFDDDIGEEPTRRVGVSLEFNPTVEPVGFATYKSAPSLDILGEGPSIDVRPPNKSSDVKPASFPDSAVKCGGWELENAPTLPEFHPLEHTAIFVPNCAPSTVSLRISNVLRELSIDATFDDLKAKVSCVTAENVDFRVRLYRGRRAYDQGIIVEVQRRFGFSTNFHSVVQAILDAAQGLPISSSSRGEALPLPSIISDSEDEYDNSGTSLEFIEKMLHHPGADAHNLALQTLSSLTNAKKMGRPTAQRVSKLIFAPNSFVGDKVIRDVVALSDQADETFGTRLMAMTVLANAIYEVPGDVPQDLHARLLPVLLKKLQNAAASPQIAYLAGRCLEPFVAHYADTAELRNGFQAALAIGMERHSALEHQSEKCIRMLDKL